MCGYVAVVSAAPGFQCPELAVGLSALAHRGPDQGGVARVELPWGAAELGMARLKIVDQHDLVVPFSFPELDVVLAFNGEIYNWRALAAELHDPGRPWRTKCDAEVVARAWRKWGVHCLEHFNGMWSLVLVDTRSNCVFLARDRAGKKPLFWARRGEQFYASSEAKGLPCALEDAASSCTDMAVFEFDCLEGTPFRDVHRLGPGQYILIRRPQDVLNPTPVHWWSLPVTSDDILYPRRYESAVDELTELVVDSVRLRASAEVPVALQLSGGLDSAILLRAWERVSGMTARHARKYCIDFSSEGIDNLTAARAVDASVIGVGLQAAEVLELLPRVVHHLDTPATWSALCLWKLAERIAGDGHRIVLSGEGADELFGGYSRYRILLGLERLWNDPHLSAYGPTIAHLTGGLRREDALVRLLNRGTSTAAALRARELVDQYGGHPSLSLIRQMMRIEFYTTMQLLLRMGDRMAAAWSLENRCPLLDYRIMELSVQLPLDWLVGPDSSKRVLRSVARALGVPLRVIEERCKKGLAIPWARWAGQLGQGGAAGSRGTWDRSGFAALMLEAWRKSCLRPALVAPASPQ